MIKKTKNKNAPITDRAEYEKLVKRVQRQRIIVFTSLTVIAIILFVIMITSGGVLKIFGVKNTHQVMNVFYGVFYVVTGIVVGVCLIFGCVFLVKTIIDFVKGLKNK